MFMSAYISVESYENPYNGNLFKEQLDEITENGHELNYDYISYLAAMILMGATIPVVVHMWYIIVYYKDLLQDDEIKSTYGHYYNDLNTAKASRSFYHMIFIGRRLVFIAILISLYQYPNI